MEADGSLGESDLYQVKIRFRKGAPSDHALTTKEDRYAVVRLTYDKSLCVVAFTRRQTWPSSKDKPATVCRCRNGNGAALRIDRPAFRFLVSFSSHEPTFNVYCMYPELDIVGWLPSTAVLGCASAYRASVHLSDLVCRGGSGCAGSSAQARMFGTRSPEVPMM